jgi:RNA polymerase sigma-70 factor (ECF subfamily)
MVGVESLLGQEQWVRRLARALVHDDDEAEDVVQETRLASWRQPPRDPGRARSWLGTVVRNVVRNRRRAQRSRDRWQGELPAGTDVAPSSEELVARLQSHRALAEAVSRLPDPFREVVLLRYYENLDSAEIARRLNAPAGTIRWRLKTGLERLRATLDADHGGVRGAWIARRRVRRRRAPPARRRVPGWA